jgi:hypothetical protein
MSDKQARMGDFEKGGELAAIQGYMRSSKLQLITKMFEDQLLRVLFSGRFVSHPFFLHEIFRLCKYTPLLECSPATGSLLRSEKSDQTDSILSIRAHPLKLVL